MAAVALLVWVKHCLPQPIGWLERVLPPFAGDSRFSRPYRQRDAQPAPRFHRPPAAGYLLVFGVALGLSLLLSVGLQRLDTRRLVS